MGVLGFVMVTENERKGGFNVNVMGVPAVGALGMGRDRVIDVELMTLATVVPAGGMSLPVDVTVIPTVMPSVDGNSKTVVGSLGAGAGPDVFSVNDKGGGLGLHGFATGVLQMNDASVPRVTYVVRLVLSVTCVAWTSETCMPEEELDVKMLAF